ARREGGHGRSRNRGGAGGLGRSPENPVDFAANQHCQTLEAPGFSGKTVDGWLPKPALCDGSRREPGQIATQKKVRDGDLMRRVRKAWTRTRSPADPTRVSSFRDSHFARTGNPEVAYHLWIPGSTPRAALRADQWRRPGSARWLGTLVPAFARPMPLPITISSPPF